MSFNLIKPVKIITCVEDYPYGAYDSHHVTNSMGGFPPMPDPELGEIFYPSKNPLEWDAYPALAFKLSDKIFTALSEYDGVNGSVQISLRTASSDVMVAACGLSSRVFLLSEYVNRDHALVKIAMLDNFAEFKQAVDAL
jgi:hypothetical protein